MAFWFALAAAIALQAGGMAWYWASTYWVLGLVVFAPGYFLHLISIPMSLVFAMTREGRTFKPLLVNGLSVAAFVFIPYSQLAMTADFFAKRHALEEIVAEVALVPPGTVDAAGQPDLRVLRLEPNRHWLIEGELIYLAPTGCGDFVFFPTFFGIPDGAAGFLHVPDCAQAEEFPSVAGAVWFGSKPLAKKWVYIWGS